jgi:hypothetical protein
MRGSPAYALLFSAFGLLEFYRMCGDCGWESGVIDSSRFGRGAGDSAAAG